MPNGDGYWIVKWLVGALWGVVVAVFIFIGNVVKANDVKATQEHTGIRREIVLGDQRIKENVEHKIERIQSDQTTMLVQQTKIITLLEQMKVVE